MRTNRWTVLVAVLATTVLSLVGAAVSLAGDLSPDVGAALGPHGRLSIPWPMMLAQVALAVASTSRRRPVAVAATGLIAVTLLLGVVSGFFDGGYGDDSLGGLERAYQVVFVLSLAVVGTVAAVRCRALVRARRAQPVGTVGA